MRNSKIDLLRFIGLTMIILTHTGSSGLMFQLRNFDVPLMVLISGMSFGLSYKENEKYGSYLWKRIKRLVFPVWIFLTLYFSAQFILVPNSPHLNAHTITTSYLLDSGIGFVWIIRVLLLVAMISPLLFTFHRKTPSHKKYFTCLALAYIAYEIFRHFSLPYIQRGIGKNISVITHFLIPYGIMFAIGLRVPQLSKTHMIRLSAASLLAFIGTGFVLYEASGTIASLQAYKYPPSLYYFSYSLFISSTLWLCSEFIESILSLLKLERLVAFIAQNSIWIYLWHIPFCLYLSFHFVLNFAVVLAIATSIAFVQVFCVQKLISWTSNVKLKKNLKTLFTG